MSTQQPDIVTVGNCLNCPFIVLATFIPNWCRRGAKIVNAYRTPDDCPLRKGDITVKLAKQELVATGTIFTCRCCSKYTTGHHFGTVNDLGWYRIDGIDGPNAICPDCVASPDALDNLKADGYDASIGLPCPVAPDTTGKV